MYGSYKYYSGTTAPMDITPSKVSAREQSARCAFPSWPRRSSLSESSHEERPTSYLSDEDLFPSDPFEDDSHSVSSGGSAGASPFQSPPPQITEAELLEMQRLRAAQQRELVRFLVAEKERRRQAAKKQRRSSNSGNGGATASNSGTGTAAKTHKSRLNAMTPIVEAD